MMKRTIYIGNPAYLSLRLKQLEELHVSRRDIASIELQIANLLAQKAEIAASMES